MRMVRIKQLIGVLLITSPVIAYSLYEYKVRGFESMCEFLEALVVIVFFFGLVAIGANLIAGKEEKGD